jgi:hypothetical protein
MKFLCLAYYDTEKFAALPPDELQALVSQCPAHDAALRASGALRLQASLGEPGATRTLRPGSGRPSVTDGPYAETKEQVGGFFVIDATGMDEALRIAAKHPAALIGGDVGWAVEVRPVAYFEQY